MSDGVGSGADGVAAIAWPGPEPAWALFAAAGDTCDPPFRLFEEEEEGGGGEEEDMVPGGEKDQEEKVNGDNQRLRARMNVYCHDGKG